MEIEAVIHRESKASPLGYPILPISLTPSPKQELLCRVKVARQVHHLDWPLSLSSRVRYYQRHVRGKLSPITLCELLSVLSRYLRQHWLALRVVGGRALLHPHMRAVPTSYCL